MRRTSALSFLVFLTLSPVCGSILEEVACPEEPRYFTELFQMLYETLVTRKQPSLNILECCATVNQYQKGQSIILASNARGLTAVITLYPPTAVVSLIGDLTNDPLPNGRHGGSFTGRQVFFCS